MMTRDAPLRYMACVIMLAAVGCGESAAQQARIKRAEAQVRRLAEDLDRQTTETGVYIRVEDDEIKETDPWGQGIKVVYSQGGVAETLVVRSAGPDGQFHTEDDIEANGMTTNLKGAGEGIKKNAEETASNAAKGAVKGTVEGAKEAIKETFSRKKPENAQNDPENTESESADKSEETTD